MIEFHLLPGPCPSCRQGVTAWADAHLTDEDRAARAVQGGTR